MNLMSKSLIIMGVVFVVLGLVWHFVGNIFPLGQLPGDIKIEHSGTKIYFPIVSCLLISIFLSAVSFLIKKFY